jgi:hypothetical protein
VPRGEAVNGRRVLEWLGGKGQRVGLLILLIVIISLYFNIRSYYLQQRANMPNLISIWPKLYSNTQPESIALGWFNTGKKPAIDGRALLFTVNTTQTKRKKIGETPISGGLPDNGAMAKFSVDMHQSFELFLVCVTYVDDNHTNYKQVYLYRLGTPTDGPNEIPLVELQLGPPSAEVCNES